MYCVPGTLLGVRDTMGSKTKPGPALLELTVQREQ